MSDLTLTDKELRVIQDTLTRYLHVERASLFGSRAKGIADKGSDVDIAIYGPEVSDHDVFAIHEYLEEQTNLPYFFDVVHYDSLHESPLKKHIDRVAKNFYER